MEETNVVVERLFVCIYSLYIYIYNGSSQVVHNYIHIMLYIIMLDMIYGELFVCIVLQKISL